MPEQGDLLKLILSGSTPRPDLGFPGRVGTYLGQAITPQTISGPNPLNLTALGGFEEPTAPITPSIQSLIKSQIKPFPPAGGYGSTGVQYSNTELTDISNLLKREIEKVKGRLREAEKPLSQMPTLGEGLLKTIMPYFFYSRTPPAALGSTSELTEKYPPYQTGNRILDFVLRSILAASMAPPF